MKNHSTPAYQGAELFSALVFICAMSAALMYTICNSVVFQTTCIMTALTFGIYMIFYALRKKKAYAFFAFLACFFVVTIIFSVFIRLSRVSPVDFLFRASEYYDATMAAAFIPLFSFIIGFPTAYFSVYIPRPAFLLLPAFIPLLLSAKTSNGLPAGYVVFMAVGYALVILGVSRPEFPKENVYFDDKKSRFERLGALGIFGLVIAAVIYCVPRSTETPLGDYLDNAFKVRSTFFAGNGLSNFTNTSSVNHGSNVLSENVLFYASADKPMIVSRWFFDEYNDDGHWTAHKDYTTGWTNWRTYKQNLNTAVLSSKLRVAADVGKLSEYAELLKTLPKIPEENYYNTRLMRIYIADKSNTRVVIHPNMTVDVSIRGYDDKIYRTLMDEMFTDKNFGQNASYTLSYYDQTPNKALIYLFEQVDMEELLSAAEEEGVISETEKEAFINERNQAAEYREKILEEPISPRITALADEITDGLSSDYEKALAIEKWFGEARFVYDLDFIPRETTAEYFLFESRRGICTDFASAAALLMRAADIPTRYGEGFVLDADNFNEYGYYAVKAADAHAFAMGYIEGYGWLEIDGTKYAIVAGEEEDNSIIPFILLIIAIILGTLAFIFRERLAEVIFAVGVCFRSDRGKIRAVYLRTRKLACKIADKEPKSTTSEEVRGIISNSLMLGAEAEEITSCADALFYNDTVDPRAGKLYANYRKILKMKRKMRK